jgi:hypothetical protein
VRRLIGTIFLLAQLSMIVRGQFGSARWYCWAPNDYAVWYRIEARVNGVPLSPAQVDQRYQIDAERIYQNPAQNLKDTIQQRETTYGRNDHAEVRLLLRPNGGELQEWKWPPQ